MKSIAGKLVLIISILGVAIQFIPGDPSVPFHAQFTLDYFK